MHGHCSTRRATPPHVANPAMRGAWTARACQRDTPACADHRRAGSERYSGGVNAAFGRTLQDKVRASTPPHDDQLAAQLRAAHDHLRENQGRVLLTVSQFAASLVLIPAFYLSLPAFAAVVGGAVIGAGRLVWRGRRRAEEARDLSRNAVLGEARALPNGTGAPGIAAYETERLGRAHLRIEVRDGERTFTAQLVRERPRGFGNVSLERMTVIYAPHAAVLIAFDKRGEMMLGEVESEPLPEARLVLTTGRTPP